MGSLADARLEPSERKMLDRWVELLRAELGADLHEVWLYGSRARGEETGPESDVDLLVVTAGGARDRRRVIDLLHEAADEDGATPWTFSPIVYDPEFLASRRSIDSFFIQEVDRDRVVLWSGVAGDGPATGGEYPSSPRLVVPCARGPGRSLPTPESISAALGCYSPANGTPVPSARRTTRR